MSCRLLILNNAFSLITQSSAPGGQRYRQERIQLNSEATATFTEVSRSISESMPLPAHVRPCHLNQDNQLDFAGGRWLVSESAPIPLPIYETWASLDGGATFHIERAAAFQHFRPACSFIDFDGDGDQDLVSESTRLFDGGTREIINQYLTSSRLPHTIQVLAQEDTTYKTGPRFTFDLDISLESPPISGGAMLDRYQSGALVNITGDFNGDGYKDLVVRSETARIDVFLARGWDGFEKSPAGSITISANGNFAVSDLNQDGLADILLHWEEPGTEGGTSPTAAYYTKRSAP